MSLNNNYLQHISLERTRLRDATIKPVDKPQQEKLCTFCKRDIMKPYLRPTSRYIDQNGLDNGGMKPGTWYWKCPTCGEHYEMPTHQESNKRGYHIKNKVITSLPMHLGTYDRINQSWDKRKKRKGGLEGGELSDDDREDIYRAFGSSGEGASVVSEREYTYDGGGFH
jgi:hypothetical protein